MRFYELLPVPKEEIEAWSYKLLVEIHGVMAQVPDEDHPADVRQRNSRLASYLGTLNALLSAKRQQLHKKRNDFISKHPKPEKGVTEWREEVDAATYDIKLLCEHIAAVIEAIQINISTEQSNLKSIGREGQA